jgi:hypothetical protein
MLFQDALVQLQNGVPMVRGNWSEQDGYLQLMTGMQYVWKIVLIPNPNAGNFIFSVDDFWADDWMPFVAAVAPVEAIDASPAE